METKTPIQTGQAVNPEKTITITESHLKALIDESVSAAVKNRGVLLKPKRVTEREATVRFHEDKLVVGYGNVREEKDKFGKNITYMDIQLDGQEEPVTVEYLKFLDSNNKHKVKIIKRNVEEIVYSEGTFKTVNPDQARIEKKNFTARVEEAEVTNKKLTSEIEVADGQYKGQTFTVVDNEVLNK